MENTVNQRVKELIDFKSKGQSDFERKCGMTRGALNGTMRNTAKPSFDTLRIILSSHPDVSSDWLIKGEGSMIKELEVDTETPSKLREAFELIKEELKRYQKREDLYMSQISAMVGKLNGNETLVRTLSPAEYTQAA